MTKNNQFLRFSSLLLSLLWFAVQGFSQTGNFFSIGEPVRFEVIPVPGNSYHWNVLENIDSFSEDETNKVIYLSSKSLPTVLLKWEKAGTYFLIVKGFNQNGCSNTKVFPVIVNDSHSPVAIDDYISADWQKIVSVDLLSNDHDPNNDIDPTSLKILTKPEFGEISILPGGGINYLPLMNQVVNDHFYYRICDFRNQCDSARVTIDLKDPSLYFPQGISPNGDGLNDYFLIKGLTAYPGSSLTIFARDGAIIYQIEDYQNDWSGISNKNNDPRKVASGTYYYLIRLGGTNRILRGFMFIAD